MSRVVVVNVLYCCRLPFICLCLYFSHFEHGRFRLWTTRMWGCWWVPCRIEARFCWRGTPRWNDWAVAVLCCSRSRQCVCFKFWFGGCRWRLPGSRIEKWLAAGLRGWCRVHICKLIWSYIHSPWVGLWLMSWLDRRWCRFRFHLQITK